MFALVGNLKSVKAAYKEQIVLSAREAAFRVMRQMLQWLQVTTFTYLTDKENNQYIVSIVAHDNDCFLADIVTKNALVGQIKWVVNEPNILELADLVIFEQAVVFRRGCLRYIPLLKQKEQSFRHLGLGTAMLEYVIAQAKELGMKGIYGEITHDDSVKTPYLIEWYQRHGFSIGHEPKRLSNAVATIYQEIHR